MFSRLMILLLVPFGLYMNASANNLVDAGSYNMSKYVVNKLNQVKQLCTYSKFTSGCFKSVQCPTSGEMDPVCSYMKGVDLTNNNVAPIKAITGKNNYNLTAEDKKNIWIKQQSLTVCKEDLNTRKCVPKYNPSLMSNIERPDKNQSCQKYTYPSSSLLNCRHESKIADCIKTGSGNKAEEYIANFFRKNGCNNITFYENKGTGPVEAGCYLESIACKEFFADKKGVLKDVYYPGLIKVLLSTNKIDDCRLYLVTKKDQSETKRYLYDDDVLGWLEVKQSSDKNQPKFVINEKVARIPSDEVKGRVADLNSAAPQNYCSEQQIANLRQMKDAGFDNKSIDDIWGSYVDYLSEKFVANYDELQIEGVDIQKMDSRPISSIKIDAKEPTLDTRIDDISGDIQRMETKKLEPITQNEKDINMSYRDDAIKPVNEDKTVVEEDEDMASAEEEEASAGKCNDVKPDPTKYQLNGLAFNDYCTQECNKIKQGASQGLVSAYKKNCVKRCLAGKEKAAISSTDDSGKRIAFNTEKFKDAGGKTYTASMEDYENCLVAAGVKMSKEKKWETAMSSAGMAANLLMGLYGLYQQSSVTEDQFAIQLEMLKQSDQCYSLSPNKTVMQKGKKRGFLGWVFGGMKSTYKDSDTIYQPISEVDPTAYSKLQQTYAVTNPLTGAKQDMTAYDICIINKALASLNQAMQNQMLCNQLMSIGLINQREYKACMMGKDLKYGTSTPSAFGKSGSSGTTPAATDEKKKEEEKKDDKKDDKAAGGAGSAGGSGGGGSANNASSDSRPPDYLKSNPYFRNSRAGQGLDYSGRPYGYDSSGISSQGSSDLTKSTNSNQADGEASGSFLMNGIDVTHRQIRNVVFPGTKE